MSIQPSNKTDKLKKRGKVLHALPFAVLACTACATNAAAPARAEQSADQKQASLVISPGDSRFNTPDIPDYEAVYNSSSSKTGAFTLHVRTSGSGEKLTLVDVIPMQDNVIVAQRQIDLATHRADFGAGPFFAWGPEIVVSQSNAETYSWTRVPIGGGAPKQASGEIQHGGYVSDMFSPTIASLMPMAPGAKFQLPEATPRKGEFVSAELSTYEILRRENLDLGDGLNCNCWVISKTNSGGATEEIWVDRKAPYVFRRVRDKGGAREFTSDLLAFRFIEK